MSRERSRIGYAVIASLCFVLVAQVQPAWRWLGLALPGGAGIVVRDLIELAIVAAGLRLAHGAGCRGVAMAAELGLRAPITCA